jgi:hypothetical protein
VRSRVVPRVSDLEHAAISTLVEHRLDQPTELSPALATVFARLDAATRAELGELSLAPAQLLALDGGLLDALTCAEIERSIGLYVDGRRGPVLAGAWALPEHEARAVDLREQPSGAWVFGLPGSFGLAGVAAAGHAVLAQALRPATLGPGIPGSLLLRRLLATATLDDARALIDQTDLADGRNWMLADGRLFFGIEQLGAARILTRVGPKTGHVHANHCFDPALRQREATPRSPASFRRLELASTLYVQRRPSTAEGVLEFFDAVEAAAFADPRARAETLLAIELTAGVAHWRRRAGEGVRTTRLFTPLAGSS